MRLCFAFIAVLIFAPGISLARWLKVDTGRFMTMDTFDGNQENPQSLHKYLYCEDNPVNLVDPTGKWATYLHKMAIRRCLTGLLTKSDVDILCDEQGVVDGKANQDAAHSYMHAMRDGTHGQTVEEAKRLANDRVRTLLTDARSDEANGGANNHQNAMKELGGGDTYASR